MHALEAALGAQVRALVHTDVVKYLEFKAVDGSYVFVKGKVRHSHTSTQATQQPWQQPASTTSQARRRDQSCARCSVGSRLLCSAGLDQQHTGACCDETVDLSCRAHVQVEKAHAVVLVADKFDLQAQNSSGHVHAEVRAALSNELKRNLDVQVEKVPATDYEALKSSLMGLFEKRRARSFFM